MTQRLGYNQAVYYISLLAVDVFGHQKNQFFTFDEASKLDLKDTNVVVMDVHQLVTRYRERHPEMSEEDLKQMTVYKLAEDLIDADPTASYFFDECPFIASPLRFEGKIMKSTIRKSSSF